VYGVQGKEKEIISGTITASAKYLRQLMESDGKQMLLMKSGCGLWVWR
jgi:hypothetical protein